MPSKLEPHAEEIKKLAEEDAWSANRIAQHYGVAKSTLLGFLKTRGIKLTPKSGNQHVTRLARSTTYENAVIDEVTVEEKLRQELKELKTSFRKNREEDIREARVIDAIRSVASEKKVSYKPRAVPRGAKRSGKGHTLVLLWSDLHAGEVVSPEETLGLGDYDWDIMLRRHDLLRDGLLSWRDRFEPVEHLVVAALGDMVTGDIHEELKETNEMPLDECVIQLGLDGAEWLESLVPEFPKITVAGIIGNHGRREKKPRMKRRYSNADWQTYHFMAQRLKRYDSIDFQIPRASRHMLNVYGRRLLMLHGDSVPSSSMVGVPWGGIIRYSEKLARSERFDHLLMGHYHEPNAIGKRIFVNGSTKGPDEYILERHGTGSPPCQMLLPFHPDHGVGAAAYIDLDL